LLRQLLPRCPDFVPYCYEKCLSGGELILTSATLTKQLLELFCERLEKIFFVIDGLDECGPPERKSLVQALIAMVDKCDSYQPGKLRVLLVSQDLPDIRKALLAATIVSLEPKDNERDIKRYVKEWTDKIQKHHELDETQAEFIRESTFVRAKGTCNTSFWCELYLYCPGMFLFAVLVLPNLYRQLTRRALLDEIAEFRFPRGLKDA
jgi:hypothetical protein